MAEVDEGAIIRIQAKEFVKASDYDALAQVNAELLEALDNIETSTYEPATAALARAAIDRAKEAKP
jgi:hypothetical protein